MRGQQAAVTPSGDVQHVRAMKETIHLVGDEPLIPGAARGIDAGFPVVAGRLAAQPLPRGGHGGTREQRARTRHGAAGKVDLGRAFPFRLEQGPHALDRRRDARHQMDTVPRIAQRERQHVGELPGAPVAQQQAPGVERAGHHRRQQAGAGDQVEAECLGMPRWWRRAGRGPGRRSPAAVRFSHRAR